MNNNDKNIESIDENTLFDEQMRDVKKLVQNTVHHSKQTSFQKMNHKLTLHHIENERFYFSDEFQPHLEYEPLRYYRDNEARAELKKLNRQFYTPELFLDLHGLTKEETKKELAAIIAACYQDEIQCISILFGHGKNILKRQVPLWLAQHPAIICFQQAPTKYGGNAGLLALVKHD